MIVEWGRLCWYQRVLSEGERGGSRDGSWLYANPVKSQDSYSAVDIDSPTISRLSTAAVRPNCLFDPKHDNGPPRLSTLSLSVGNCYMQQYLSQYGMFRVGKVPLLDRENPRCGKRMQEREFS